MRIPIRLIRQLLEAVSRKTGYPLEYSNFDLIAEEIGNRMAGKYMYNNLYQKVVHAKNEDEKINLHDNKLNIVARYLDYGSIHHFIKDAERPRNPVLEGLVGNYYSYVRRNSTDTVIFCSPVKIYYDGGDYVFELRGPKWLYSGRVILDNGCLFIHMKADSGKQLHHVYKIGAREKPVVLQGIFSGVSTTFEPIGGRAVLVASPVGYEELHGMELPFEKLKTLGRLGERLAWYFEKYEENNLRIKPVVTFGEDDL